MSGRVGIGTIAAMPRSKSRAKATLERTKSLPWAAALIGSYSGSYS